MDPDSAFLATLKNCPPLLEAIVSYSTGPHQQLGAITLISLFSLLACTRTHSKFTNISTLGMKLSPFFDPNSLPSTRLDNDHQKRLVYNRTAYI
jgi:hypothetical protein